MTEAELNATEEEFLARVARILDQYRVVINRGKAHGLVHGQEFSIFSYTDEHIVDPETDEDLEPLEILKGHAKVSHLQEKIATLVSSDTRTIREAWVLPGQPATRTVRAPLDSVEVGDYVRPR